MKLTLEQLLIAVKKSDGCRKFLIFGPEEMVVSSAAKSLLAAFKNTNDFDIEDLQYAAVKDEMFLVRDGLKSRSLFGGQKLIIINGLSGVPVKDLIEIYKQPLQYGVLIVVAGDLGKTSALRKLAEESKDVIAVACYKPDVKAMQTIIKNKLIALGLHHDVEIAAMIAELLPANTMVIDSELEKLALYKGDDHKVTIEDITACFAYSGEASLDELIHALVSRDLKLRAKQMQKLQHSDLNFMLVIRSLLNFFNKLLQVHINANTLGVSVQSAVQSLRPPLFFKSKDNMMLACNKFSLHQTKAIIARLVELERRCKSGVTDNKLLLQHFLLRAIS